MTCLKCPSISIRVLVLTAVIASAFCVFFNLVEARAASSDSAAAQAVANELASQAKIFREETKEISFPEEMPQIQPEAETKPEAVEAGGPVFTLKKIRLEGNTLFTGDGLDQYISKFLDRPVSFAELNKLAEAITLHYRSKGFITSHAYIPSQTIEDSTAVIKIVEGKVGNIVVEDNRFFKSSLYSESMRFRKDRILYFDDLQSSLYFLNQKIDRKAKSYLVAGSQPFTTDIVLKAEEENPIHLYYEYNNRGTKLTHRARHLIHFDHNNFLGHGDALSSSLSLAEEGALTAGSVDYAYPLEKTRTTVHAGASWVESNLVKHVKPLNIEGRTQEIHLGLSQNFVKTIPFSLDIYGGMDLEDSKSTFDGEKTSFDRLRILKFGPVLNWNDNRGRTVLSSYVHTGIPSFLGSLDKRDPNASRDESGGEFVYFDANLVRIERLPWNSFLVARTGGQWTNHNLPSPEQFRLGGAYSVRGYPESDASGDYGYSFSTEINTPVPFLPKEWQILWTKKTWHESVRLVGFLDGGKTYLRERAVDENVKDRFLLGTGFGVRVDLGRNFSLRFDLGFPIGDDSSDENQKQVHITVTGGF